MKKMIVVFLCLSCVSATDAGLALVASGNDRDSAPGFQFVYGDVVKISLVTAAGFNGFNIDAISDFDAQGSASNIWSIGTPGLIYMLPGYIENTPDALVSYVAAYASGDSLPAGITVFSFDYHTNIQAARGSITIAPLPAGTYFYEVVDGTWYTVMASTCDLNAVTTPIDGVTIYEIPEPMTLGLLGLGSLFLRRRMA